MYERAQEIQALYKSLTSSGRRGALKEVSRIAGCKTRNDVTRVFRHQMRSKYTQACVDAAKRVIAAYEEKERLLLDR